MLGDRGVPDPGDLLELLGALPHPGRERFRLAEPLGEVDAPTSSWYAASNSRPQPGHGPLRGSRAAMCARPQPVVDVRRQPRLLAAVRRR